MTWGATLGWGLDSGSSWGVGDALASTFFDSTCAWLGLFTVGFLTVLTTGFAGLVFLVAIAFVTVWTFVAVVVGFAVTDGCCLADLFDAEACLLAEFSRFVDAFWSVFNFFHHFWS